MSFSGLGIVLSIVFGCLLLALVAEFGYLIWWKKRTCTETESDKKNDVNGMLYGVCCWKTPSATNVVSASSNIENKSNESDIELGSGKDVLLKTCGEESVDTELMRLHNLAGPPRFLFTIKEETKEDLEFEDGKSRGDRSRKGSRSRSLSDLMVAIDSTPFLNPMACSPLKCSLVNLDSYEHQGFNPLFESTVESEFSRSRSSPPPKFKFLRDAEEKLYRRLIEEAHRKAQMSYGYVTEEAEVKDPPNSTMVIHNKESFLQVHLRFFHWHLLLQYSDQLSRRHP
ncbi:uncharacterized protein LOC113859786 [Abrus precatorius]|uniref:Uncharacterized protein LOC113859786 n=1 Tax=Abrus precatorius TaxID=3816 RepID=A0A8B8KWM8_ABRPR|nr:uncharacterized protein LOC113859786 [Abrus precatorius]